MTQSCISDFSTLSPVSSTDLVLSLSTDNMSSGDRTDSEDYVLLDHSVFRRTSIPSVPSSVTTLSEAFSNSEGELLSWFPRLTVEDRPNDTPAPTSSGCSTPNKSSIGIFDDIPLSSYAVAASFISSYIATPHPKRGEITVRLRLLCALLIEFGVSPPDTLPTTLTSASKLLKKEIHINIKQYVAVRNQGQAVLKKIMLPSQAALQKQLRKKANRVPLKWAKERGLEGLLVRTCGGRA